MLEKQRMQMILDLQAQCKHPEEEIFEVPYRDNTYFRATPPFRVCRLCGLGEEGWGCGYWKLDTKERVPMIDDSKARCKYLLKFYTQEEMNKLRFKR